MPFNPSKALVDQIVEVRYGDFQGVLKALEKALAYHRLRDEAKGIESSLTRTLQDRVNILKNNLKPLEERYEEEHR
jgi:hypothetical protein